MGVTDTGHLFRCDNCREEFAHGIHIGRNVDRKRARYANYCSAPCRDAREAQFRESDRKIRNREVGRG